MSSQASAVIGYDGPTFRNYRIPIEGLAAGMPGIAQMVRVANDTLNAARASIKINVGLDQEQRCVQFVVDVLQTLPQQIHAWVSDAKRYFSQNGNSAYGLGQDYMKGAPIRQEYLKTAIKWIRGGGDIEEYMGRHRHDPDAMQGVRPKKILEMTVPERPKPTKRKYGRPETRVLKLNVGTREEAFRRIFGELHTKVAKPPVASSAPVWLSTGHVKRFTLSGPHIGTMTQLDSVHAVMGCPGPDRHIILCIVLCAFHVYLELISVFSVCLFSLSNEMSRFKQPARHVGQRPTTEILWQLLYISPYLCGSRSDRSVQASQAEEVTGGLATKSYNSPIDTSALGVMWRDEGKKIDDSNVGC